MANKRMFSKEITESDAFADMPLSSQALYFHLGMSADDDGFVNNAKKIQRGIGASPDDLSLLVAKKFVIPFDSGVLVIKHWHINNTIRPDRKKATNYVDELAQLTLCDNGSYSLGKALQIEPVEDPGDESQTETARQKAYKESDLPYSFEYKVRQAFFGTPCPICGAKMEGAVEDGIVSNNKRPTIQHCLPISKGGKHELGNIAVICKECNVTIKDTETGKLNSEQVIKVWDDICRANDGQMTGICPSNVGIDIDKVRVVEDSKDTLSGKPDGLSKKVAEILDYLNAKLGTRYRASSKKTSSLVNARLKEGFTVDDFKTVIDKKCAAWMDDPKMSKYLRPETLFGTKFEGYLNERTARSGREVLNDKYAMYVD